MTTSVTFLPIINAFLFILDVTPRLADVQVRNFLSLHAVEIEVMICHTSLLRLHIHYISILWKEAETFSLTRD